MTVAARALPMYLVNAVVGIECLQNADIVRDIVQELGGDGSRAGLDHVGGTSIRGLVVKLMNELSERPAGLALLVEGLERLEGPSIAIRRLRVATAAWEVDLLESEDWDELFRLLDGVAIPDLHRRYREFLQERRLPLPDMSCNEPWTVFLHAATLNARPGSALPCYVVLRQLLAPGAEAGQFDILAWADLHDPSAHVPDPPSENEPLAEGIAWTPSDYLIIRIRPLLDRGGGRDAILSHWKRTCPGGQIRGTDRRVMLADAEMEVRTLIKQVESDWAHRLTSDLALEFVLPRDLLHLEVERWSKASFQGVVGILGEDHEVVVRSMERMERRDLHSRWTRRWRAFTEGRAGRVHWFPEDGRPHLLSDPPPAVVILSGPPDKVTERPADELAEALRVGVPVVLWARTGAEGAAFRTALESLLKSHNPCHLPTIVKLLRIASNGRETHVDPLIGQHVALLWDDPTRMPVASVTGGSSDSAEVEGS